MLQRETSIPRLTQRVGETVDALQVAERNELEEVHSLRGIPGVPPSGRSVCAEPSFNLIEPKFGH
ncbi:MAG: hypothetical protein EA398_18090 [Deltaproteobacteria bacterium]|nr:MAG: hypothetical protein EA398_18090 [Deltaproteobacteria bacterium]